MSGLLRVLSFLKEFLWSNSESAFFFSLALLKINTVLNFRNPTVHFSRGKLAMMGAIRRATLPLRNWYVVSDKGTSPSRWAVPSKAVGRVGVGAETLAVTAGWNVPPPQLIQVISFCEGNHQIKCFNYQNYMHFF